MKLKEILDKRGMPHSLGGLESQWDRIDANRATAKELKAGNKVMTPDGEGIVQNLNSMIHNDYQIRLKNKKLVYYPEAKLTLCESMPHLISIWRKNGKSFMLWQKAEGGYYYELSASQDSTGKFKKIKIWKDSNLKDIRAELKKDSYHEARASA